MVTNWQSNSVDVLKWVGEVYPESVKREKFWCPKQMYSFSTFKFVTISSICYQVTILTERNVHWVVICVFDPLGFIATYTIYRKLLIQDIWQSGVGWAIKSFPETTSTDSGGWSCLRNWIKCVLRGAIFLFMLRRVWISSDHSVHHVSRNELNVAVMRTRMAKN